VISHPNPPASTARPAAFPLQPFILLLAPLALFLLTGCGSTTSWNMMPTPTVHQYLGEDVFAEMADEEKSSSMEIFYATDRPGSGPADDREYDNGSVDQLSLGKAVVHFGDRHMTWNDLLTLSIHKERSVEIPLGLENATELATIPGHDADAFSRAINRTLAKRQNKLLTLYVHGAKSSFFKSCVQGAQFHHFMRHEGVLVSYAWPSTGRFLGYDKDVEFAAQSVARFAALVEFLAANTDAEKINILCYSAGAQVVAPALASLRERFASLSTDAVRRKLRIEVAYFAAPDVSLTKFTNTYLPTFHEIVGNTTVTFHKKDGVLSWATSAHNESRLGRPDAGELTEAEIGFLEDAARRELLDAIDMQYSPEKRPFNFKAHGNWYSNEWVSSDVILQFVVGGRPDARGLKRKPDSEAWYFPPDYADTLKGLVAESKRKRKSKSTN
jgi:esterase/lipase superfamily enzyme